MVNQPIELHDFVNQTRAAEILGCSRMTIWQRLKEGKIQAVIVGGLRMIPKSEIERLERERLERERLERELKNQAPESSPAA